MTALTQIVNNEIFAVIAVLVKLLSRKVLFLRKLQISRVSYRKIINGLQYFQNTFETRKRSFINVFSICVTVPLNPDFFHFFKLLNL